ncbi:uncharacterized protein LOC114338268 isoform X2 [Diabrotica virgifera virgifera]|uniref:Uncharacterized protein n=1 Tax=Diabrotica virgifera virgifera TaxID=50390 RepID=A0ABM5IW08_DIAVI|nr:uncharacterized protein LOC114338268 isoform X2 [Diabrotica virgifera virgifera]
MNRHKSCKGSRNNNIVGRAHSTLSVSAVDYYLNLPVTCPPSPAVSTVTLTPGRIRNIDQDMENLRASRQDNPFIQKVIASRESIIDSLDTEEESDHANLMAKELSLDLDVDPMSLPEMHEHMIRSPPPTNWPKSPNFRVFHFPHNDDETISVEVNIDLTTIDTQDFLREFLGPFDMPASSSPSSTKGFDMPETSSSSSSSLTRRFDMPGT